ncbi:MAG: protoporphyrinogen oxidase [Parachlamydia sp.]|nr:protoporphyrinogen oxidase [Parachlamydia sp.]
MPKSYIILGGGISGLSLAWQLQKDSDAKVTLVEQAPRLGGWIETLHKNGFLFDRGPRSCRSRGSGLATLQLIEELGLEAEVIPASPAARRRYLYLDKRLQAMPNSLPGLLFSPVTNGLFKALWQDIRTRGGPGRDESVADFAERRMGRAFAERFFDPLVTGIFAGDMHKLSLRACFPFLAEWEEQHGGIVRALFKKKKRPSDLSPFIQQMLKTSIFSFRNGMETLPQRLAERLNVDILLGEAVEALHADRGSVRLSSGRTLDADHIFSTLPAHSLQKLLPFSATLNQIPYASTAVVNLGYRKRILKKEGFGYLIPSSEREQVLGVVFDSSAFPQQGTDETRLTVMLGDSRIPDFGAWSKEKFLSIAQEALMRHLGIDQTPDLAEIKIAPRAIPQYLVGHLDRLRTMEQEARRYPKLTLLGSSFYGVSVNDCIARSSHLL